MDAPIHTIGGLNFLIRNVVPDGFASVMAGGTVVGILDLRSGDTSVLRGHEHANTFAVNQREFDRISAEVNTRKEIAA